MKCDCIDRVQKQLTDIMVKKNPGCEVVEEVRFQNISWVFNTDTGEVLNNPVLGKYKIGNKVRKWTRSMLPSFCPFCGKPVRDEEVSV